jgi:hypothetical protein
MQYVDHTGVTSDRILQRELKLAYDWYCYLEDGMGPEDDLTIADLKQHYGSSDIKRESSKWRKHFEPLIPSRGGDHIVPDKAVKTYRGFKWRNKEELLQRIMEETFE